MRELVKLPQEGFHIGCLVAHIGQGDDIKGPFRRGGQPGRGCLEVDAAFFDSAHLSKETAAAASDLDHAVGAVDEKIAGPGEQPIVVPRKNPLDSGPLLQATGRNSHGEVAFFLSSPSPGLGIPWDKDGVSFSRDFFSTNVSALTSTNSLRQ